MSLHLPHLWSNTRFVFSVQGLVDDMGFSIASVATPHVSAEVTATAMALAWTSTTIGSASQWNDEFTFVGTNTTYMHESGPILAAHFSNVAGTNAGDAPPVNCSILVTKVTAEGGRKNRGRFNIPSGKVEEAGVSAAGFILPATVTALQNQLDDFYDAIVAIGEVPYLLHSDPGEVPTEIQGFQVSSQMATQRRRMR